MRYNYTSSWNRDPKASTPRYRQVSIINSPKSATAYGMFEPERTDRRCKRIRLTARARQCDAAVSQAFERLEAAMCTGMSEDERQTLRNLLDLAGENLRNLYEQEAQTL